jgi:hypothetical protein
MMPPAFELRPDELQAFTEADYAALRDYGASPAMIETIRDVQQRPWRAATGIVLDVAYGCVVVRLIPSRAPAE